MPGIKIASPMTPNEYKQVYDEYMRGDDTVYVSEHRKSYENSEDIKDIIAEDPEFVLFPFSITRFNSIEAAKRLHEQSISVSVFNQLWINPLKIEKSQIENLKKSKHGGVVLDDDYPNGIAKQIAHELMLKTGKKVYVLCIKEKTAGFQPHNDNLPPSPEEIYNFIKDKIENN
jgi:pyruvate/2-oxoglutarate/acetoin dehydrogenase E1 component